MVVPIDSTAQVIDDRQPTPKASNASLTPPPKSSTSSSKTSPTSNRTNTATTPQQQKQRTPQQQTKPHIISGGTAPQPHGTSSFNPSSTLPARRGANNEEFKNQLVHDVFGRDNKGKVPMEKVAMLIWQFRDDPAVVQFMAQFVAKVRCSFYLFSFELSAYDMSLCVILFVGY